MLSAPERRGTIPGVSGVTKVRSPEKCSDTALAQTPLWPNGLNDNFHAAEFTWSTPDVGAIPRVSGVTKSALTPVCWL